MGSPPRGEQGLALTVQSVLSTVPGADTACFNPHPSLDEETEAQREGRPWTSH